MTESRRDLDLRPIVAPCAPRWLGRIDVEAATWPAAIILFLILVALWATLDRSGWFGLSMILPAFVPAGVRDLRRRYVMGPPAFEYRGTPIRGEALGRVMALDAAYKDVESEIGGVPGRGMTRALRSEIRSVLWEAAADAAEMTRLESELADLRDAPAGSAQDTLARELRAERDACRERLVSAQDDALRLRHAVREAAAAARLALSRTGAAHGLPDPPTLARTGVDGIAAAADSLEALAAAWSTLDESQAHTAASLDPRRQDGRTAP